MLTPEENALLTEVGPGTPCGALLRRYWQPVCYVGELTAAEPRKAVKVMAEELVVFRSRRELCLPGGALRPSLHVAGLRLRGARRLALCLPRLEIRRDRPVRRAAVRAAAA